MIVGEALASLFGFKHVHNLLCLFIVRLPVSARAETFSSLLSGSSVKPSRQFRQARQWRRRQRKQRDFGAEFSFVGLADQFIIFALNWLL